MNGKFHLRSVNSWFKNGVKSIFFAFFLYVQLQLCTFAFESGAEIDLVQVLGGITDVMGLNQYYGWYGGKVNDFGLALDKIRRTYPNYRILTTEYGAGAIRGKHSSSPDPRDFSEEYQIYFHKAYMEQLEARSWYPGAFIWNQFDFGADWRRDGTPHINNKGLLDFKRQPKPVFFYYRKKWNNHYDNNTWPLDLHNQIDTLKKRLQYLHASSIRRVIPLNSGWYFKIRGRKDKVKKVDLPHTWNASDTLDNNFGYVRGIGSYSKSVVWPKLKPSECLFLNIRAGGQHTRVIVDGEVVAEQHGMFLGFRTDLTEYANKRVSSVLVVDVDNSKNPVMPPVETADYNIYGGLYRGVQLEILPKTHLSNIKVDFPCIKDNKFVIKIRACISATKARVSPNLYAMLEGPDGASVPLIVLHRSRKGNELVLIADPGSGIKRWSPEKPNLYILKVSLKDKENILLDEVRTSIGFRYFSWKPGSLPELNGRIIHFRGTSRHQDKAEKGNALTLEDHITDLLIIKEMGANAVRLAHYPQDPYVLDLCDLLGLLVWEEIPVTSGIPAVPVKIDNELIYVPHPVFMRYSEECLRRMIIRDYNHPSIIFWGLANEILTERSSRWRINVARELLTRLNRVAKKLDPARLTGHAE